jgi:hypothetical protein
MAELVGLFLQLRVPKAPNPQAEKTANWSSFPQQEATIIYIRKILVPNSSRDADYPY